MSFATKLDNFTNKKRNVNKKLTLYLLKRIKQPNFKETPS